jgi:hypothetical protein
MLNLPIAMMKIPLLFSLVLFMQTANISITSPQPGDVLRGKVEIVGNTDVPGFSSAELAFSYASNPADSWYTIQTFSQPLTNATITTWDTTLITDGDYILHLRVFLQDGSSQDVVVSNLKVGNYLPVSTETPLVTESPQLVIATPQIESVLQNQTELPATPLISYPTSTLLPPNPVSVTTPSIYSNFDRGALITLIIFLAFALLLRFRKN